MIELVIAWVALVIGFVAGCSWNADAYDRGVRDAERKKTDW